MTNNLMLCHILPEMRQFASSERAWSSGFLVGVIACTILGCNSSDPAGDVVSELEARGAKVQVESGKYKVDIRNVPDFTDAELDMLAQLPNITELTLQNVPITDAGLAKLEPLTRLERLILNESDITGKGLEALASLPGRRSIFSIGLRSTRIADADLKYLKEFPKLSRIDLSGTKVSDAGLTHLEGVQARMVNVKETKVTEKGVASLKEALPDAEVQI